MHVRFGSARRCRSNINYTGFNRGKAHVNFKITVYSAGDLIDVDDGCFVTSFVLMTAHFSHQHRGSRLAWIQDSENRFKNISAQMDCSRQGR